MHGIGGYVSQGQVRPAPAAQSATQIQLIVDQYRSINSRLADIRSAIVTLGHRAVGALEAPKASAEVATNPGVGFVGEFDALAAEMRANIEAIEYRLSTLSEVL